MASIDRTAYPQFRRAVSVRELRETFTPDDEVAWAREKSRTEHHLLALLVWLKTYGRLGYFLDLFEVPPPIVEHIRGLLELKPDVEAVHDSTRTAERHRDWVRERLGVTYDPPAARALAQRVIREAVRSKDNPADLINVVLEELVRARLELPGYTTLDELVAEIRAEVNGGIFAGIATRMSGPDATELDALLLADPVRRRSRFDRVKMVAGAATVGHLKDHVKHLAELEAIGPTEVWLEGVLPAKVAHFAGEARETDAADLGKYGTAKRQALIASLVHVAKISTRDEIATMLCKRMAIIHKRARERLEVLRAQYRGESERLLDAFGDVLAVVRDALGVSAGQEVTGEGGVADSVAVRTGRMVLSSLERSGGITALSAAHEEVSAHHGNNYLPFVEKFYRGSGSGLFQILDVLEFEPASADRSVYDAMVFLRANRSRSGEYLSAKTGEKDGQAVELDLSFADLVFYRPSESDRYEHIDSLFAADAVDWKLIETHWPDLMRVALSVRAGRISSVTLLRRLGSESRRNRIYRALREVGRAVRTIVLLRYLSEPQLREGITAVTNRVEAFHGFAGWLSFGREQLAHNDPVHQEKTVKFNELLANCAIYSCTLDITTTVNDLTAAGVRVDREDLATVTPYITSRIRRFGDWKLDLTPPPAVPAALDLAVVL